MIALPALRVPKLLSYAVNKVGTLVLSGLLMDRKADDNTYDRDKGSMTGVFSPCFWLDFESCDDMDSEVPIVRYDWCETLGAANSPANLHAWLSGITLFFFQHAC